MMRFQHLRSMVVVALLALMALTAAPAGASREESGGARATSGRFETLPAGEVLGFDIGGNAMMVRIPGGGGQTKVVVNVRGLDPGFATYPAHVHNASCATGGGGHYQHQVGGPVDAVNEIWPVITSRPAGTGHGLAIHGHWARPEAQSIVIHYPADTSKRLACADLS